MDTKTQEFYDRLKEQLETERTWPNEYLFKFIVPGDPKKVAQVEEHFDGLKADIQLRNSSSNNFTSVSVRVQMKSAQAIVDKYIALSTIEGLMSF
ncbi:MAG: DUF493 family protein [Flavobacteriaceae bacterium]|jgi:putative lipoic acid-binding regulatory protein|nr:DUF493 family protein [Flavobacteriaceae bacterium]